MALSNALHSEHVKVLTTDTFDKTIKSEGENWFIKFYAPWCGHCKKIAPIINELATDETVQKAHAHFGVVDCTEENSKVLCERFGVQGYPTMKFFTDNGKYYRDYGLSRNFDTISKYVTKDYKVQTRYPVLSLDEFRAEKELREKEMAELEAKSKVVVVTKDNFDEMMEKSQKTPVFFKFYAPWCGHCKRLHPIWNKMSIELHDANVDVTIARVNCDEDKSICRKFGATGFPTLVYTAKNKFIKFKGPRSLDQLSKFASQNPAEVLYTNEITEDNAFWKFVYQIEDLINEYPIASLFLLLVGISIFLIGLIMLADYCMDGDDPYAKYQKEQQERIQLLRKQEQLKVNATTENEIEEPKKENGNN